MLRALEDAELLLLKQPGMLERRLSEIDAARSIRRIYVMGCGRSGTWVLTHVMATFKDTEVVRKELAFEYFGLLTTSLSVLVLKRDHLAYRRIEQIPERIEIAYIVRHPFDVLTSHLPGTGRQFHVMPERWRGEISTLRHLVETNRQKTKIVRYEDLATSPRRTQADLAGFFGLRIASSIDQLRTGSNNPSEAPNHRARNIDSRSVDKFRRDPEKLKYLATVRPELGPALEWVGKTYDYDLAL
jgi:hypothetical protein